MNEIHGNEIAALLIPTTVTLVSARNAAGEDCVASIAWVMPLSHEPSIIAVSIRPGGKTARAIVEGEGFVVNVLPAGAGAAALACGSHVDDRLAEAGLTVRPASQLAAPLVEQAVSWVECALVEHRPYGDHELYIGRTLVARTRGNVNAAGKVIPEAPLLMGQRGCFGHFEEDA